MKNNRQNLRTTRKKEGSSTYVVGDSMINGMDERKMSNRRRIIKVRAHLGVSISDMFDYLRPILHKNPSHLVLHAGTNNIRNLSSEEILEQFDKMNGVVSRDSPKTKLILSCSSKPLLNKINNLLGCWFNIIILHSNLLCYIPTRYLSLISVTFNRFFRH